MNVKNMELLLRARYAEPWRHYHNWEHITRMMREFAEVQHLALNATALKWAIMFHDAVYEPSADNNEERSAQLAKSLLSPFLPCDTVERIINLILLTKYHNPQNNDIDGQIICDCDLAVMGWDWEQFDDFGQRIREEYQHVCNEDFRRGRRAFMEDFLKRKRIFQTKHFFDKYEAQARENINYTIALLS